MKDLNEITSRTLSYLKDAGADAAHCTATFAETREFNVDGGEFSLFRTLFDNGLTMSGYAGGRKGSGGINVFDDDAIRAAADDCMKSAATAEPDEAWQESEGCGKKECVLGTTQPDMDAFFQRLREFVADVKEKHPKILIEQMIASYSISTSVYRNSRGAHFETTLGAYDLSVVYSAHDGDATSSMFGTGGRMTDLSRPILSFATIDRDMADVERQIVTKPVEGKFTGVAVFTPDCMSEVLSNVENIFLGDSALITGTSLWKDKLGHEIASPSLSIRVDPLDSRILRESRHTVDGRESKPYDLIENGVLRSFMLSDYAARKTGNTPAANDSSAFFIQPGDKSLADIIASIQRGILVARFSGGRPNSSGEMSGVAKNSFLIEDGKVTDAVSETMINVNLADMLQHVVAVSSDVVEDGYSVSPWVAFDGVTVTGK